MQQTAVEPSNSTFSGPHFFWALRGTAGVSRGQSTSTTKVRTCIPDLGAAHIGLDHEIADCLTRNSEGDVVQNLMEALQLVLPQEEIGITHEDVDTLRGVAA